MKTNKIIAGVVACSVICGGIPYVKDIMDNIGIIADAETIELKSTQLEYKELTDYIKITGLCNISSDETDVKIPATIDGKKVSELENNYNFSTSIDRDFYIKKLTLSDTLKKIHSQVFYYPYNGCFSLQEINIPKNVEFIGDSAFEGCQKLHTVEFAEEGANIEIGAGVFERCTSLSSITIPDRVRSMGGASFYGCTALENVKLSSNMTSLPDSSNGYGFFQDCTSLKNIEIPEQVSEITANTFSGCKSIETIKIGASLGTIENLPLNLATMKEISVSEGNLDYSSECGVLFNKDKTELIKYPYGSDEHSYTVPDTVTTIGNCAFQDAANLEEIIIPENVEKIGTAAFKNCKRLKRIVIKNPECDIDDTSDTFCLDGNTLIIGYQGSTAESYVLEYSTANHFMDITSPEATATTTTKTPVVTEEFEFGDINKDHFINASDSSILLAYYAYKSSGHSDVSLEEYLLLMENENIN